MPAKSIKAKDSKSSSCHEFLFYEEKVFSLTFGCAPVQLLKRLTEQLSYQFKAYARWFLQPWRLLFNLIDCSLQLSLVSSDMNSTNMMNFLLRKCKYERNTGEPVVKEHLVVLLHGYWAGQEEYNTVPCFYICQLRRLHHLPCVDLKSVQDTIRTSQGQYSPPFLWFC